MTQPIAFQPLGITASIAAPSGASSASTTLPGVGGSALRVYNATAFPITWAISTTPGGAAATGSSTTVAAGLTEVFSMPLGTTDVAVYGIGGTGTVYLQRGDGI